jgi:hypothetical protein
MKNLIHIMRLITVSGSHIRTRGFPPSKSPGKKLAQKKRQHAAGPELDGFKKGLAGWLQYKTAPYAKFKNIQKFKNKIEEKFRRTSS